MSPNPQDISLPIKGVHTYEPVNTLPHFAEQYFDIKTSTLEYFAKDYLAIDSPLNDYVNTCPCITISSE
jgi:hypothetical protein